jgi:hypothetical protein
MRAVVLLVGLLVALASAFLLIGASSPHGGPVTSSVGSMTICGMGTKLIALHNSSYCADDVTNYIVVQNPGYAHYLNNSIAFRGVTFSTICPSDFVGCPMSTSSSNRTLTTLYAAAIGLNMTFQDKNTEAIGAVIGESNETLVLSKHVGPRCGILIQYASSYKTFLLVEYPENSA